MGEEVWEEGEEVREEECSVMVGGDEGWRDEGE